MNKLQVIKALQNGLSEAISIIEYQGKIIKDNINAPKDPVLEHTIEQLKTILKYSEHVHESAKQNHILYINN